MYTRLVCTSEKLAPNVHFRNIVEVKRTNGSWFVLRERGCFLFTLAYTYLPVNTAEKKQALLHSTYIQFIQEGYIHGTRWPSLSLNVPMVLATLGDLFDFDLTYNSLVLAQWKIYYYTIEIKRKCPIFRKNEIFKWCFILIRAVVV